MDATRGEELTAQERWCKRTNGQKKEEGDVAAVVRTAGASLDMDVVLADWE